MQNHLPYDGDAITGLGDTDGAVFTGSAVDWNTQDPRAAPLADAMRAVFAAGVSCFNSRNGLQPAAPVLGGISDVSPDGRQDGLAKDLLLTDAGRPHPMMAGRVDGYAVPCVHRDDIIRLPEGAGALAGSEHSPVQAMEYARDGVRFWGMQYHPEYKRRLSANAFPTGSGSGPALRQICRSPTQTGKRLTGWASF